MIKYENECVCCPKEMGCMGSSCPNRNVPHYYCDYCGEEIVYGKHSSDEYEDLCEDCYANLYEDKQDE